MPCVKILPLALFVACLSYCQVWATTSPIALYRVALRGFHCDFDAEQMEDVLSVATWREEVSSADARVRSGCSLDVAADVGPLQGVCNTTLVLPADDSGFDMSVTKIEAAAGPPLGPVPACLCRLRYAHAFCKAQFKTIPSWAVQSPLLHNLVSSDPVEVADVMSPLNWVATYTVFQMVLLAPALNLIRWCFKGARAYPVAAQSGPAEAPRR